MKIAIVLVSAVVLSACSSSTSRYMPANSFPTREAARRLSEAPKPPELRTNERDSKRVGQWTLVGNLPTVAGTTPVTAASAWSTQLVNTFKAEGRHVVTEQATCFARQMGHFAENHGNYPFESLKNFMAARCGMTSIGHSTATLTFEAESVQAVWDGNRAAVEKWMQERADQMTDPAEVGLSAFKLKEQVVFLMTSGSRGLEFQDLNMRVEGDSVVIRGESSLVTTDRITASVTKGAYGVGNCVRDTRVAYPAFTFTCDVDARDGYAYVDFSRSLEGRLLGHFVSRVLVSAQELPNIYVTPAIRRAINSLPPVDSTAATSEQGAPVEPPDLAPIPLITPGKGPFEDEVVRVINHVRAGAGLAPITFSTQQSAFNQKMIPYFFDQTERAENEENEAVLAVMAGWDVDGFIVKGSFSTGFDASSDPSNFVDALLESAHGRELVLGAATSEVAVGTMKSGDGAAVLVSSFEFMPKVDFNQRVAETLRDLNRARAQRNLPALKESVKLRGIARGLAERIESNQIDLDDAGSKLAEQYILKYKKGCRYWRFVASEFDDMDFAKEILETQKGRVSILVAPYRPKHYAWGYYAIVIVVEN